MGANANDNEPFWIDNTFGVRLRISQLGVVVGAGEFDLSRRAS